MYVLKCPESKTRKLLEKEEIHLCNISELATKFVHDWQGTAHGNWKDTVRCDGVHWVPVFRTFQFLKYFRKTFSTLYCCLCFIVLMTLQYYLNETKNLKGTLKFFIDCLLLRCYISYKIVYFMKVQNGETVTNITVKPLKKNTKNWFWLPIIAL